MYFPDRGCVQTLLTLYVYATEAGARFTYPGKTGTLHNALAPYP